MFSYHYFEGDGEHFCYAAAATERCPYAIEHGPDPELTERQQELVDALDAFGLDGKKLLRRAHGSYTDRGERCTGCGAKRERVGYRVWREIPIVQARDEGRIDQATLDMNSRIGADRWQCDSRYFGLKREAIAWCREQAQLSKSYGRES